MADYIKLRKGLNVPMVGAPQPVVKKSVISEVIALKPTDFKNLTPKLLVREGDTVKAGTPVYADKFNTEIVFTSPVSGVVTEIVRGEKRKLLEIRIKSDEQIEYIKYDLPKVETLSAEKIIEALKKSGLWVCLKQRPYGIIPNPAVAPKAIFVSGFSSVPAATDFDFALKDEFDNVQLAVNALSKLTKGGIHFGLSRVNANSSPFHKLRNVNFHTFDGPHPADNVGVQIHHISPVNKGEVVWTIDLPLLAVIGKFFAKGIIDFSRTVAITGPRATEPCYVKAVAGMSMKDIAEFVSPDTDPKQSYQAGCETRYISGNALTGSNVGKDGYLGFFDHQVTLITEGNYYEGLGWAKIFRPKKFSSSRTYFSWLTPKKEYNMDTNFNGGERAFVMNKAYNDVLPMDIYPVYLLKAILAEDIDKMEQLGIYEVIEEDFALCEYICPSKIDIQAIIAKGIDIMLKEMA
jgi:Na+-transporting NADH:ubiquinone oxidoreductase subunit A